MISFISRRRNIEICPDDQNSSGEITLLQLGSFLWYIKECMRKQTHTHPHTRRGREREKCEWTGAAEMKVMRQYSLSRVHWEQKDELSGESKQLQAGSSSFFSSFLPQHTWGNPSVGDRQLESPQVCKGRGGGTESWLHDSSSFGAEAFEEDGQRATKRLPARGGLSGLCGRALSSVPNTPQCYWRGPCHPDCSILI